MENKLSRKEAISFLEIPEKNFDNYLKFSGEIVGQKIRGRWYFDKSDLELWDRIRKTRTVELDLKKYEKCFEFAKNGI